MNQYSDFEIRLATETDIEALTELHCASFRPEDHVPMMLGKDFVRATYRWQVSGKSAYTLVADAHGKIIGLVSVCDGPFTMPMFMACLPEFALSLIRSPSLLFRKKLWQRLLRRPDLSHKNGSFAESAGFAQMMIVAVDKDSRGKGIFPALVKATKSFSKARGSRAIRVGIYKTNTPSLRVFINNGWIETPELETHDTVFYVAFLDPDVLQESSETVDRPQAAFDGAMSRT